MKKIFSIVLAGLLLFTNCYAMVDYSVEEFEPIGSSKLYENADFLKNTIYLGDNVGYITSVNGEQFYVNRWINYYGYQKVYSLEVFNFF